MTLALTIYLTDEPLGVTGYGTVAIPSAYVCVAAVLAFLIGIYLITCLIPTPTVPPRGRQP